MIVSDVGRTTARSASSCEKTPRALDSLARAIPEILEAEQAELLRQATELREGSRARCAQSRKRPSRRAMVRRGCHGPNGEQRLLVDGLSVRCLVHCDGEPVDDPDADGVEAIVARAY